MDANAWITLAIGVSAAVVALLGLIAKAAFSVGGKVSSIESKMEGHGATLRNQGVKIDTLNDTMREVCDSVQANGRAIESHNPTCDDDRAELWKQMKQLRGA